MTMIKPPADVDNIIRQIYRGPLESEPWSTFLQTLRVRLNADNAAMSLIPGSTGTKPHIAVNRSNLISKNLARYIDREHSRLTHLDILGNALKNPGDIFTADETTPWPELKENEFYLRVMKPSGIRYQLGMCFSEPSGWHCHVGLMNSLESGDFGTEEKEFLIALRPHLELALEYYALIRLNEMEKEIYESTLDRLTVATFIVGGKGQIICLNRTADNLLQDSDHIYLNNNELMLKSHNDNKQLNILIQKALSFHQQKPEAPTLTPFVYLMTVTWGFWCVRYQVHAFTKVMQAPVSLSILINLMSRKYHRPNLFLSFLGLPHRRRLSLFCSSKVIP